jgi:hypothetical protein
MSASTIRLVIELDPTVEPITGTPERPGGLVKHFHGWLALTEAVEASRRAGSEAALDAEAPCTSSSPTT